VILSTLFLYLTLAGCAILLATVVVKYDLYRREPWWLLLAATILGALAMQAAGWLQTWIILAMNARGHSIGDTLYSTIAGVSEESGKLAAVAITALLARRHFDEPLDGLIFGSFAGLGAALAESVSVLGFDQTTFLPPPQEPIRLAGHLIMGGIVGFGVGLLVLPSRRARTAIVLFFLTAVIFHIGWNMVAFAAANYYHLYGKLLPWHTFTPVCLMIAGMILYRRLVAVGARLTRDHLQVCDVETNRCPPE